jgi:hypothetical protein
MSGLYNQQRRHAGGVLGGFLRGCGDAEPSSEVESTDAKTCFSSEAEQLAAAADFWPPQSCSDSCARGGRSSKHTSNSEE